MFARMNDPFSGYGRRAYFDPSYGDYQYIMQQQELARQAELEAAYRREMAARAYRHKLEQEEQQRAYQQRQRALQEQQRRRFLAEQLQRERQQCHPHHFFFGQPSHCQPSHCQPSHCQQRQPPRQEAAPRTVFVRVPSPSREQQEKAARVVQKQWRRHQLERKANNELEKAWQELGSLKSNATFPAQPVFDTEGRLLYNAANAPVHGYVDALEKLLLKLDAIESHGLDSIKTSRRRVVHAIEQELARVESWKKSSFKPQAQPLALPAQPIIYPGGLHVAISDDSASGPSAHPEATSALGKAKQLEDDATAPADDPHPIAVDEPEQPTAEDSSRAGSFDIPISDGTDSLELARTASNSTEKGLGTDSVAPSSQDEPQPMAIDQGSSEQPEQSTSAFEPLPEPTPSSERVPVEAPPSAISIDQDTEASTSIPIHFESSDPAQADQASDAGSAMLDGQESEEDLVSLASEESESEPYVVV